MSQDTPEYVLSALQQGSEAIYVEHLRRVGTEKLAEVIEDRMELDETPVRPHLRVTDAATFGASALARRFRGL